MHDKQLGDLSLTPIDTQDDGHVTIALPPGDRPVETQTPFDQLVAMIQDLDRRLQVVETAAHNHKVEDFELRIERPEQEDVDRKKYGL